MGVWKQIWTEPTAALDSIRRWGGFDNRNVTFLRIT